MPLPELLPWPGPVSQAPVPGLLEQVQALPPWGLALLMALLLSELLRQVQVLLPVLRLLLPGPPERALVLRTAEQTQCR